MESGFLASYATTLREGVGHLRSKAKYIVSTSIAENQVTKGLNHHNLLKKIKFDVFAICCYLLLYEARCLA